ncbi:LAETG motif-containing sortase-dependent surface protein [Streptomyces sp. NPDC101151]|uniref:LAETG motif-containing sortase-dependent surface protein n=1 Tax=Streptomyces sp. NPDC101151 TaxID=3366115 RepID=UPI003803FC67
MSLSRRAARAARVIGTSTAAAALSVAAAHTALACSIGDFSATAGCDAKDKGVIRVTDKDPSGTPATISVYVQLSMPGGERWVATRTIDHPTAEGVSVDFDDALEWYPGMTFRVHVKAGDQVDDDIEPMVVVPDVTCGASPSATAPASAVPSTHPSTHPSATSKPSSAAPAPAQSSSAAPTPAASGAPSPAGGGTRLAETGAGDGTTVIAGAAAALVVAGGGIVVALRRKAAHRSL